MAFACAAFATAVALCTTSAAHTAYAEEGDEAANRVMAVEERDNTDMDVTIPEKYQEEVERTTKAYDEAVAKTKEAKEALSKNREKIDELEEELPKQAERSKNATRAQYKLEQEGASLVDLLLNSNDFYDFMANFEYVSRVSDANIAEMNKLSEMREELEQIQRDLKQAKHDADESEEQAKQALEDAKEARAEAQRRAQEQARREAEEARRRAEEAKARMQAEEARRMAAEEEEAAAKAKAEAEAAKVANELVVDLAEGEEDAEDAKSKDAASSKDAGDEPADDEEASADASDDTSKSDPEEEESLVKPGDYPTQTLIDDGADWSAGKSAFVEEWGLRIDAYLQGSPLEGHGKTFAEAAWKYGVDPRWSPAISATESSKGAYCFASHNAWGWGSSSWKSWKEAIDAHVGGLSRGYGYTITISGAQTYCPPNWVFWYDTTVSEMNSI